MAVDDDDEQLLDLNTDPVFVHVYPGSRVIEMALPSSPTKMEEIRQRLRSNQPIDTGSVSRMTNGNNVLNSEMVTTLQSKVEHLVGNQAVSVLFFASRSPDVFSSGLFADFQSFPGSSTGTSAATKSPSSTSKRTRAGGVASNDIVRFQDDDLSVETLTAINKLALTIQRAGSKGSHADSKSPKRPKSAPSAPSSSTSSTTATVAVYGGSLTATAYAVYAGCDYRLATGMTEFSVPEVSRGVLPAGGAAYHLAQSCGEGVALARYLAITGDTLRWVYGTDLFVRGGC
jgi:enoyl-CoA hydratase/carnithine racemase